MTHDVRARAAYDLRAKFDTPTLIELWRTAPYLHHGRYRQLIAEAKRGSTPGNLEGLDRGQLDDLVAFVLSL